MPATIQNTRLFHSENGFTVVQDGNEKNIQSCFVSPEIRRISPELLSKFIAADNYLKISELRDTDGNVFDYKLDACNRLRGGGPWFARATFIVGSIATVGAALLPTPASNVAAIAGGIAGGVATGPV